MRAKESDKPTWYYYQHAESSSTWQQTYPIEDEPRSIDAALVMELTKAEYDAIQKQEYEQFKKGGCKMPRDEARNNARDIARRRAQESTHSGGGGTVRLPDGVKFFENKRGDTVEFDVLPYKISDIRNTDVLAKRAKIGDLADCRIYWRHGSVGPEEKLVICLKTVGKPCPVCEAVATMRKNPNADPQDIKDMTAKERALYNLNVDPKGKKIDLRVWDVSYHLFTKMLEEEQAVKDALYDHWTLDKGSTLSVRFREKHIGRGDPFFETSRIDYEAREPYGDDVLEQVVDLDAALNVMSYDQLNSVLNGVQEPDEEKASSADDKKPETRSAKGRGGAVPAEDTAKRGRGTPEPEKEDKIHQRNPDVEKAAGRHLVDPEQDALVCAYKGTFGIDTDKLKECAKCDQWTECDDEYRKNAKKNAGAVKESASKRDDAPPARGRGSEDPEPPGRGGRSSRGR